MAEKLETSHTPRYTSNSTITTAQRVSPLMNRFAVLSEYDAEHDALPLAPIETENLEHETVEEAAAAAQSAEAEVDPERQSAEEGLGEEQNGNVRVISDPGRPSRAEVEYHEVCGHVPFRSWCQHCVAGRAPDDPHCKRGSSEETDIPKVSLDYCFLGAENDELTDNHEHSVTDPTSDAVAAASRVTRTVLVLHARPSGMIASRCVEGKGREDPDAVSWVTDQLRRLGVGRCILQADGEPAQRRFVKDIIEATVAITSLGVSGAHSPAYDHKANGAVERAIREVKGVVRTRFHALQHRVGHIPPSAAIFDWLVESTGELITGMAISRDGMTAHRRIRGRCWAPKLADIGEQVMARRPQATNPSVPSLNPRWDRATYLCTKWGTAEHWVAMSDGTATRVFTIRRITADQRWIPSRILEITGTPAHPDQELPRAPTPITVRPVPDGQDMPRRKRRTFNITAQDLQEYGLTRGCAKCDAILEGREVGTAHSSQCRARFAELFESIGDTRISRARERRGETGSQQVAVEEATTEPIERPASSSRSDMFGDGVFTAVPEEVSHAEDIEEEPAIDSDPMINAVHADLNHLASGSGGTSCTATPVAERSVEAGHIHMNSKGDIAAALLREPNAQELGSQEQVRRLCSISGMNPDETKKVVTEMFSPPRVNDHISRHRSAGLSCGTSFDLRINDQTGESWNFLLPKDRRECWRRLENEDPWVVIGSPPCTDFCPMNIGLNYPKMSAQEVKRRTIESKTLLLFVLSVYKWQARRGKYFLHEHPWTAISWKLSEVIALMNMPGVHVVRGDGCQYGMKVEDKDGQIRPARKATGWMSNAKALLNELSRRCRNSCDRHANLMGGRAAQTAIYPPELCAAIVRGLQRQWEADRVKLAPEILAAMSNDETDTGMITGLVEASSSSNLALSTRFIPEKAASDGTSRTVAAVASGIKATYDEYTGETLPDDLVDQGKREELEFFRKKGVWRVIPRSRTRGARVIGTRWVCCNKGDAQNPDIRCRLVCQEVNTYDSDKFFAATPPLEALRMILSFAAEDSRRQVSLVDISRAYFNAPIKRTVYVRLPPEAGFGPDMVAQLEKCLYGTRDAAQGWEATYSEAMRAIGFRRGKSSPCVFVHPSRNIRCTVHGDDFFAEGLPSDLTWFESSILSRFEGKAKGRLAKPGDELRVLNRIVRRTSEGYEWEADQRHSELLVRELGLNSESKPVACPGRKLSQKEVDNSDAQVCSNGQDSNSDMASNTQYRALTARANFLSLDRPDISFSVKELCRAMSNPSSQDWEALKRLARYLVGRPRLVWYFPWQTRPSDITVLTDSDWAGCVKTRKSTSGGVVMRGIHTIKHWSTTQSTVALSSAEAELIALVRGGSEALGARSLLQDFGSNAGIDLGVDASATIGVVRRNGVGRVRHLDVRYLWLQEKIGTGEFRIRKVLGTENPADLMTKHLSRDAAHSALAALNTWFQEGRATAAPNI